VEGATVPQVLRSRGDNGASQELRPCRRNRRAWDRFAAEYLERVARHGPRPSLAGGSGTSRRRSSGYSPTASTGRTPWSSDAAPATCRHGSLDAALDPWGIDLSRNQLATAARLQEEFELRFPLVEADGEAVPLRDRTFDLAISEYGVSIWCDPYRWVPETARLLRPGGELVFLVNGTILMLCVPDLEAEGPAGDRLRRNYFGMHGFEWADDPGVEFHLGYGDWIRLLRQNGFEVTDLIEVRPPEGSTTRYPYVTLEWARRWPCEEVWKARRVA
jgi:SAM-dependent methyltransferase